MIALLWLLLTIWPRHSYRNANSRRRENVTLSYQVAVLQRQVRGRVRFSKVEELVEAKASLRVANTPEKRHVLTPRALTSPEDRKILIRD
jgi:hypothetical protein